MKTAMDQLLAEWEKFSGGPHPDVPALLPDELVAPILSRAVVASESFLKTIDRNADLLAIAENGADLLRKAIETMLHYGLPVDQLWNEAHRAVMDDRAPAISGVLHLAANGEETCIALERISRTPLYGDIKNSVVDALLATGLAQSDREPLRDYARIKLTEDGAYRLRKLRAERSRPS
jgi:hypothetical protein